MNTIPSDTPAVTPLGAPRTAPTTEQEMAARRLLNAMFNNSAAPASPGAARRDLEDPASNLGRFVDVIA